MTTHVKPTLALQRCGPARPIIAWRPIAALVCASLLAGCAFPRKDHSGVPGPAVIKLTQDDNGFRAVAPNCDALLQPSRMSKWDDERQAVAFGCATYTNLAEQVARPTDLTHPKPYAGQSPDTAGAAVQRYRENTVTPLRSTTTTDIGAGN